LLNSWYLAALFSSLHLAIADSLQPAASRLFLPFPRLRPIRTLKYLVGITGFEAVAAVFAGDLAGGQVGELWQHLSLRKLYIGAGDAVAFVTGEGGCDHIGHGGALQQAAVRTYLYFSAGVVKHKAVAFQEKR